MLANFLAAPIFHRFGTCYADVDKACFAVRGLLQIADIRRLRIYVTRYHALDRTLVTDRYACFASIDLATDLLIAAALKETGKW